MAAPDPDAPFSAARKAEAGGGSKDMADSPARAAEAGRMDGGCGRGTQAERRAAPWHSGH